jgi:hypothetical protein
MFVLPLAVRRRKGEHVRLSDLATSQTSQTTHSRLARHR